MPALKKEEVDQLLREVPPRCTACGADIRRNYCRQHDVFVTEFHEDDCINAEHVGHRGYDENSPAIGRFEGWIWERDHGSYRIGGTRGPIDSSSLPDPKPVDVKPL